MMSSAIKIEDVSDSRISIEPDIWGVTITVPSRKNWFGMVFMSVWLCGWVYSFIRTLDFTTFETFDFRGDLFLLFWLGGWTAGGILVLYKILKMMIGQETLVAKKSILRRSFRFLVLIGGKNYHLSSVRNFRWIDNSKIRGENSSNSARSNIGKLQFEYGPKTITCCKGVDAGEGAAIIKAIAKAAGRYDIT